LTLAFDADNRVFPEARFWSLPGSPTTTQNIFGRHGITVLEPEVSCTPDGSVVEDRSRLTTAEPLGSLQRENPAKNHEIIPPSESELSGQPRQKVTSKEKVI